MFRQAVIDSSAVATTPKELRMSRSVAFTMDVYSHIIEGMQSDAMALLDEVLPPEKNGIKNKINAKLTPTRGILTP